ncbi:MAG: alanine--tRNA ligase, partial [Candidatus Omnitrophota bacterium]
GKTAFHHSFFEMLGNFSFGDYFKEEAISWAWEYLTQVLRVPAGRLRVSVHQSDDEAFRIWKDKIGVRESWIYRLGDKSNFWPANAPTDGPNGPCGPCSEIYYDQDPAGSEEDLESARFAEIWNLVFTQFDRRDGGELIALAQRNIDTGMGLERLACVMQGKSTNFEIDLFEPILAGIGRALKLKLGPENRAGFFTIADHLRAVVFSVSDGVSPSNEGRGYVIRKLIRRAIWHAHQMVPGGKLSEPFLHTLVGEVARAMKNGYPELTEAAASIASTLEAEEERFLSTLDTGLRRLEQRLDQPGLLASRLLPGEDVFELYDTYGFPEELTHMISQARGFEIDREGFERLMDGQKKRAKEATKMASEIFVASELEKAVAGLPATRFLGYDTLRAQGRLLWQDLRGAQGVMVFDSTPFYGESGGQAGDSGVVQGPGFSADVRDTQKMDGRIVHYVEVRSGASTPGQSLDLEVDPARREATMRNHTATHLLHAALRQVLGAQVRQLGSLVNAEKLRFDYSFGKALTREQSAQIESLVNEQILKDLPVQKTVQALSQARESGALAFFGEKYGDEVRVLTIGNFSKELCGGTHCDATGQIGSFILLSDSSVASGTRRVEGFTGAGALAWVRRVREELAQTAAVLKSAPFETAERAVKLTESLKRMEKQKEQTTLQSGDIQKILSESEAAGDVRFAAFKGRELEMAQIRQISDQIRSTAQRTVYWLGAEKESKLQYLVGISPDLAKEGFDVRPLAQCLDRMLSGKSGGPAHMVQGGAGGAPLSEEQWAQIKNEAVRYLKAR